MFDIRVFLTALVLLLTFTSHSDAQAPCGRGFCRAGQICIDPANTGCWPGPGDGPNCGGKYNCKAGETCGSDGLCCIGGVCRQAGGKRQDRSPTAEQAKPSARQAVERTPKQPKRPASAAQTKPPAPAKQADKPPQAAPKKPPVKEVLQKTIQQCTDAYEAKVRGCPTGTGNRSCDNAALQQWKKCLAGAQPGGPPPVDTASRERTERPATSPPEQIVRKPPQVSPAPRPTARQAPVPDSGTRPAADVPRPPPAPAVARQPAISPPTAPTSDQVARPAPLPESAADRPAASEQPASPPTPARPPITAQQVSPPRPPATVYADPSAVQIQIAQDSQSTRAPAAPVVAARPALVVPSPAPAREPQPAAAGSGTGREPPRSRTAVAAPSPGDFGPGEPGRQDSGPNGARPNGPVMTEPGQIRSGPSEAGPNGARPNGSRPSETGRGEQPAPATRPDQQVLPKTIEHCTSDFETKVRDCPTGAGDRSCDNQAMQQWKQCLARALPGGPAPVAADEPSWTRAVQSSPKLSRIRDSWQRLSPRDLFEQVAELAPRERRSLNKAPREIRQAALDALDFAKREVDHAVLQRVKSVEKLNDGSKPPWIDRPVWVDDFRTPGKQAVEGSYPADRDFRVLYRDKDGNAFEVEKEYWQEAGYDELARLTKYTPDRLRTLAKLVAPEYLRAWDTWNPQRHQGKSLDAAMKQKWGELHGWLATDKSHIEAHPDYSDQVRDPATGKMVQRKPAKAQFGREAAFSKDPHAFGIMCKAKVDDYLKVGNTLEAMAQLNKCVDTLLDLHKSMVMKGVKLRSLDRWQASFDAVKRLEPYDMGVTAEQIAQVEKTLAKTLSKPRLAASIDRLTEIIGQEFDGLAASTPVEFLTE
jgi:hypothetical protein